MKFVHILSVSLLLTMLSCKKLDIDTSQQALELPAMYDLNEEARFSNTEIDWKAFFADSLLNQLIAEGLESNFDLKAAQQKIAQSLAVVQFARGQLLPIGGVNSSAAIRRWGLYTMDGAGNISTEILPGKIVPLNLPDYYGGGFLSWEADVWGKLNDRKKSSVARYMASMDAVNFIRTQLVAQIANTYFELLALDNELDIIRKTIERQSEALEVVKYQKEAGRTNQVAVQQFFAQLLNSQALEQDVLRAITSTENYLNFLLGRLPSTIQRNAKYLLTIPEKDFAVGEPAALLLNRPDVRQAEQELVATKFELKAARKAFFPSLNFVGAFGLQAFSTAFLLEFPTSVSYTALSNLTAPLINRSELKAQFNFRKSEQEEAFYNYQQTILNGYREVATELNDYERLSDIKNIKTQENEVLSLSVQSAYDLYLSAKAEYVEVLLAQQNALQSNLELIRINKEVKLSKVELYRALGGGWQQD